ncbi:hypothetical protein AAOE16_14905 [Ekhidna sp. MALMAid0563]|uniref:hypothetical protein n=1 Tax=Ekhidna sp. MALMAid0563 TaxID=3143937 RepID=UPI0032DECC24
MQKLKLEYCPPTQGEFSLKKLNFLFVFQVNCPGCFMYGIPLVDSLYRDFGEQISFLGLSTAFEDFDLNTAENTNKLISSGEMIGETQKAFSTQGKSKYPIEIAFPIAMDRFADHTFDLKSAAEDICLSNPNFSYWPEFEKNELRKRVTDYLKSQVCIPLTFTLNQMRGTPTFILFNKRYEILRHYFGHQEASNLSNELAEMLSANN